MRATVELMVCLKKGYENSRLGLLQQAIPAFPQKETHPFLNRFLKLTFSTQQASQQAQKQLRSYRAVAYVEPIYTHQFQGGNLPPFIPSDPLIFQQWYLTQVGLPELWEFEQGNAQVVVAVLDAGVDQFHPDLQNKWVYNNAERFGRTGVDDDRNGYIDDSLGFDFATRSPQIADLYYHGTAVSGLVAAETNNGIGMSGAGFNTRILPIKVSDLNSGIGQINLVNLYEAMVYAADQGAQILNISGGRTGEFLQWEQDIIRYLVREQNVVIVAAAGNDQFFNQEINYFPAAYEDVLSVTATDPNDYRVNGFALSPMTDISAPGVAIETSYNRSYTPFIAYTTEAGGNALTGTSFATPLVSGTAALLRSAYPNLNALQISELLRVSSDPIDQLSLNQAYEERLGKGRLNALRAYLEKDQAEAVRMDSFTLHLPPMTETPLNLTCTFTNYLAALPDLSVTLSSTSPDVQILNGQWNTSALQTLESRAEAIFTIELTSTLPKDADILFRLEFRSSSGYTDYQYFYLREANPSFFTHDFNTLSLTVTQNGRLGFADTAHTKGKGLLYRGENFLAEAGLMIGLTDGRVMDALEGDQDFLTLTSSPRLNPQNPFRDHTESYFSDGNAPNPAQLAVKEEVIGRRNAPHQNYVTLRYTVQNQGTVALDSLWLGLFMDWDFPSNTNEQAQWNSSENFAYAFSGAQYLGLKVIGQTDAYQGVSAAASNSWTNTFTEQEKQDLLRQGIQNQAVLAPDVAQSLAQLLTNLAVGESRSVTFILSAANSLNALQRNFQAAENAFAPPVALSPVPFVRSILCPNPDASFTEVFPTGGQTFRLYTPSNLTFPIQSGNSLQINKSDYGKLFYLSCTDSLLESDPLAVVFSEKPMEANFIAPDTFDISNGTAVRFTNRSPTPAVAWFWDFGDGTTARSENPVHTYQRQGDFLVTLTITDAEGCQKSTRKTITIVRQGPVPSLANSFTACSSDSVVLSPTNGTHFRFYRSFPSDTLGQGTTWTVKDTEITQVWITNLDSTLESEARPVSLDWNLLFADFDPSPEVDTLVAASIQFTDESRFEYPIQSWNWDFGDGQQDTIQNPLHAYNSQGIYEVTLRVTDVRGCTSEAMTQFRVGRRGPVPTLPAEQIVCLDNPTAVSPEGGSRFRFYADPDLTDLLYEGQSYAFTPNQDTPANLYITNTDSIIESFPAALRLVSLAPQADFEFLRELFLDEQQQVRFQNLSDPASRWHWDFGDGTTSAQRNPTHTYSYEGTYFITLTLTTAEGCTTSETKRLIAFRRSPRPRLSDVRICQGDAAVLAPEGGTNFRFFDSPTSDQPVFEGQTYTTPRLQSPQTYYITNTDSTLESFPQEVKVRFSKPVARIAQESDTLNLRFDRDIYFVSLSQAAQQWYWSLGEGKTAITPEVRATYETEGRYEISLLVRDSLGCLDTARSTLTVIDTLLLPTDSIPEGEPYQLLVFPNPTPDDFSIQLSLRESAALLGVSLYDPLGRLVRFIEPEWSFRRSRQYGLEWTLRALPEGMYLLVVETEQHRIIHKIVKE